MLENLYHLRRTITFAAAILILAGIGIAFNHLLFQEEETAFLHMQAIQGGEDYAHREDYHVTIGDDGRYVSNSPAQDLAFAYVNNAYRVKAGESAPPLMRDVVYSLSGVSVNGTLLSMSLAPVTAARYNRLSQQHGTSFRVDYTTTASGMRQDFVILEGPADWAVFQVGLRLETALKPMLVGGNALLLLDPDSGEKVLSYKDLKAFDASGKKLEVHMDYRPADDGRSYVVRLEAKGTDLTYPVTIDPLNAAEWSYQGAAERDKLGAAIAVCDVNGDSRADLIVGVPGARRDSGQVQVFLANGSGVLPDIPSFTINGYQPASRFGSAVACAGDVDGDGFNDILVGASNYDEIWNPVPVDTLPGWGTSDLNPDNVDRDEGAVFIYYGSALGLDTLSNSTSDPVDTIFGQLDTMRLGYSLAGLGDINGDNIDDIIIGAYTYTGTLNGQGAAGIYYGSDSGISAGTGRTRGIPSGNGAPNELVLSPASQAGGLFGSSVTGTGDLNGDGRNDFVVGAPGEANASPSKAGKAHVFFGGSPVSSLHRTLVGQNISSRFGIALASGDFNGDDNPDIAIGADQDGFGGTVFVFNGNGAGIGAGFSQRLTGPALSRSGTSLGVGNFNGPTDTFDDLIVGAPGYTAGQGNEGGAMAYYGSAAGLVIPPGWLVESDIDTAYFGNAVAVGDFNGDGADDAAVGAVSLSDASVTMFGGVYTFLSTVDCGLPQYGSEPVFTSFPANITVSAEPGRCGATVTYETPVGAGDCGVTVVLQSGGAAGSFFPVGDNPVTYRVTDSAGNFTDSIFTIKVVDDQAPVVTSCPSSMLVNVPTGQSSTIIDFNIPAFSDNCPLPPGQPVLTAGPGPGAMLGIGVYNVQYTATDANGNKATCISKVVVVGGNDPSQSCQPFELEGSATIPVALDAETARIEYKRGFTDSFLGQQPRFGLDFLLKIVNSVLSDELGFPEIPDWVIQLMGGGDGGINLAFVNFQFGVTPGFNFDYGVYSEILGSGNATVEASITTNVCVNHPAADYFGCRDTISISTTQDILAQGLNLDVDPGVLTQAFGVFFSDFRVGLNAFVKASACIGIPNPVPIGPSCIGYKADIGTLNIVIIPDYNIFKQVYEDDPNNGIITQNGASYEIKVPIFVVCEDFYDTLIPGFGDAISCATGIGENNSVFQIIDDAFGGFLTGAASNPFSYDSDRDELTVSVPDAWGLIPGFPPLPEFDFTFGRLNRNDITGLPQIVGDEVSQSACEFNFQKARLDVLSLLDVVLSPLLDRVNDITGPIVSIGSTITVFGGVFTLDLADINVSLRNKLIGAYSVAPQITLNEIQLGEPMYYRKASEGVWSAAPSTVIPNVAVGEVVQLVIPDYPPTPSPEYDDSAKPSLITNKNLYSISGQVTLETKREANLDIGFKAFEIGGSIFAAVGTTLPALICVDPLASVPYDLARVQHQTTTLDLRAVGIGGEQVATMAEWVLEPDDLPAVVTTQDTTVYLNDRGVAYVTPASVFNSDPDLSYDPPIGPPSGFPVVVDPSSGMPRGTGKLNLLEVIPSTITCEMWPRDRYGEPFFEIEGILIVEDDNCNITKEPVTITVRDTTLPYVTCRDLTIALNPDGYYHLNVDEIAIGGLDNCNFVNATVTPSVFSCRDVTAFDVVNGMIVPRDSIDVTVEVEDVAGNISTCMAKIAVIDTLRYDFGDLVEFGDSGVYPTELEDDGARHYVPCEEGRIMLGATLDREPDGRPSLLADGDGEDEDGIIFLTPLIEGQIARIQVNAINTTMLKSGRLYAFAEFNGDGNLTPISFVSGTPVLAPQTSWTDLNLDFIVPAMSGSRGSVQFRFRLSSDPQANRAFGAAADGEVEDYSIRLATVGNLVWEDRNYNGLQDVEEIPLGINGVEVTLLFGGVRSDGTLDEAGGGQVADMEMVTVTGPWMRSNGTEVNGIYYFRGLIPGNYRVEVRDPNTSQVMAGLRPTLANNGENATEEDRDSDGEPKEGSPYEVYVDFRIADHISAMDLGTDEEGIGDQDLSRLPYPNEIGGMPDGQVEQRLDFGFTAFDFGDLPNGSVASEHAVNPYRYGTTWAEEGARHLIRPDLYLGACVDAEREGRPDGEGGYEGNGGRIGDDGADSGAGCADDEDGVRFITPLIPGYEACVEITYAAPDNFNGPDAYLKAWADWNGNGMLEEEEQVGFQTLNGRAAPVEPNTGAVELERVYLRERPDRTITLCFEVPADATFLEGAAYFRFRLSAGNPRFGATGILPPESGHPEGRVPYGEVEDYFVPLTRIGNLVWEDRNYNWIQDFGNYLHEREPGINGVKVYLIFSGKDGLIETRFNEQKEPVVKGDDRVYATTTANVEGEDGLYYFGGLLENGPTAAERYGYRLVMITPQDMHPVKPNQPPVNGEELLDSDLANGSMTDQTVDDLTMVMLNFHIDYGKADDQPVGENGLGDDHGEAPAFVSGSAAHELWQKFPDAHVNQSFDAGFYVPCKNVADAGEIGYDQLICGPGADPDPIISLRAPSGGEGALEYLWMKSTESAEFNLTDWELIPGTNTPDYDPGPLYETTYYARCVRRQNCISFRETNVVKISIGDDAVAEIVGPQTVCAGTTVTFAAGPHGDQARIKWRLERIFPLADGTGSDFTYTFKSTGIYYITLTLTENNCTVTTRHRLLVTTNPYICSGSFAIEAIAEDNRFAKVSWQIPEELKQRRYIVEYTVDGQKFKSIGMVEQPVRNVEGWNYFEFRHEDPRNGWNHYRVRQDDPEGNSIYSNVAGVAIQKQGHLAIAYPNPLGDEWLTIELLETLHQEVIFEIFNVNGVRMGQYRKPGDIRRYQMDFSHYPAGVYIIHLRYGDTRLDALRIVKQ